MSLAKVSPVETCAETLITHFYLSIDKKEQIKDVVCLVAALCTCFLPLRQQELR